MRFQRNIFLLLGIEARRHVEFTGIELVAPMKKVVTGPVEKVVTGPVEKAVMDLA